MDNLETRVAKLEADRIADLIVMSALIKTHSDKPALHLMLTTLLEPQLESGALGRLLSSEQREYVRATVEWLGAIR